MNVIHLISNKCWGGGERYALDLCAALEERGHSTAVITRKGYPEVDGPFTRAGIAVGHLPLKGALDILSPLVLSRILDRLEGPVVVHVHNFKDAVVALRARRLMKTDKRAALKVVCTRHLVRPAKTGRLDRNTYRDLDALIFVSETARAAFMKTAPAELRTSPRVHTVPNAVRLPHPPAQHEAPKKDGAPFRFIFAGRISDEKGVDILVEAFRKVELAHPGSAVLTICGTGDSRTVMPVVRTTRAPELEGKVTWAGHVDDIFTELAKADAGVVPSRAPESFGLAALEFMWQGLPVIASDAGALTEVVRDGKDGLIVPPGDAGALAAAMIRLLDSPDLCASLGESGKKRAAENFGYDKFVDSIIAVYEGK